jgi:hypothetical protein
MIWVKNKLKPGFINLVLFQQFLKLSNYEKNVENSNEAINYLKNSKRYFEYALKNETLSNKIKSKKSK